jgi:hypothetical protein
MMYRILFTYDDQVFDGPYLTPPPPWQQADEGDLEKLAMEAVERLMMERQQRHWAADAPNGFQIVNERDEVVKAERVF